MLAPTAVVAGSSGAPRNMKLLLESTSTPRDPTAAGTQAHPAAGYRCPPCRYQCDTQRTKDRDPRHGKLFDSDLQFGLGCLGVPLARSRQWHLASLGCLLSTRVRLHLSATKESPIQTTTFPALLPKE